MRAARIAAAGALLAGSWALYAKPAKPAAPSAQELVAARQAGMAMGANTLGAISNGLANGAAPKTLGFPARSLDKWAKAMPALFAANTSTAASRAKPEVWSDKAGFAARAKVFQDATQALVAATQADDKDALATALASTKAACKGCHDSYQVPAPPPKAG
jgi:cytochrome c556